MFKYLYILDSERVKIRDDLYSEMPKGTTRFRGRQVAPTFRGRIPLRLVRSYIGRHEIKQKGTLTGLSQVGERRAQFAHLEGLKTGRKYRITTSTNPRAFHTGRIAAKAYQKLGGIANTAAKRAKPGKGRVLREISLDTVLAGKKMDHYMRILVGIMKKNPRFTETQAEEQLIVNWMKGSYTKQLGNARQLTDDMIYLTLGLGREVSKRGGQNIELRNISHSGLVEMVFLRLTGRDFRFTGGMVEPGEGLTIHFLPNEKAILEYRQRTWDVTKNLKRSIAATRKKLK